MAQSAFYRTRESDTIAATLALRPRKAAAVLSLSLSTLDRLTKSGEIAVVKIGRVRLYELSVLEEFLKSRRVVGQEVAS
jgi:excisionase family DNA binding protein